jgi:hypothetical protein
MTHAKKNRALKDSLQKHLSRCPAIVPAIRVNPFVISTFERMFELAGAPRGEVASKLKPFKGKAYILTLTPRKDL